MPRSGSASTLALEMSDGPQRLVVNCGGPGPLPTDLSDELVAALRTTAAHSTLVLADTNSTNIQPDGSLGKGVEDVSIDRSEDNDASRIEASHDGYVRGFGMVHKRSLMLGNDGKELRGEDQLVAQGPQEDPRVRALRGPLPSRAGSRGDDHRRRHGRDPPLQGAPPWNFRCRGGNADDRGKPVDRRPRPAAARRSSLPSSAKFRHSAAKSAGSSAAPAKQKGMQ